MRLDDTNHRELDDQHGFTLVEALVSLAIIAISLGVLTNMFATSSWRTQRAEELANAGLAAQSLLARVGNDIPLQTGHRSGETERQQRWDLRIEAAEGAEPSPSAIFAYKVMVRVSWGDRTRERSVSLTTLRLRARGERLQ